MLPTGTFQGAGLLAEGHTEVQCNQYKGFVRKDCSTRVGTLRGRILCTVYCIFGLHSVYMKKVWRGLAYEMSESNIDCSLQEFELI